MNPLRLTKHEESGPPDSGLAPAPPGPYATTQSPSTINSWLDVLVRFLNVSEAERRSIRDELADHLHNRIRDLTLAGTPDHEATRQAVAELGDAAALARSFNQAIGPSKRSRIMQIAVLSIAGLAATLSTAAFVARVSPQPPGAQQQLVAGGAMPGGPAPANAPTWDASFSIDGAGANQSPAGSATFIPQVDPSRALLAGFRHALPINAPISWQQVFDAAAKASDRRVFVRWDQFEMLGLTPETKIKVMDPEGSFADIIAESGALSGTDDRVAVRQENNRLVFAPESFFDRQEQVITAYNIAPLLADEPTPDRTGQITRVITDLTYSEHWDINGGNRAKFSTLDSTLFVHAPARFHDRIRWILQQLISKEHAQGPRVIVPMPAGGGAPGMSGGGGGMSGPAGQPGGGGGAQSGGGKGGGAGTGISGRPAAGTSDATTPRPGQGGGAHGSPSGGGLSAPGGK